MSTRVKELELPLHIAMEIKSTETIKQAVIAGTGIAFLSAHTVTLERENGSLVVLDVQGFPHMRNWYVVHREKKRRWPRHSRASCSRKARS